MMRQTKIIIILGVLLILATSSGCVKLTESTKIEGSTVHKISTTKSAMIITQTTTNNPAYIRTSTHVPTLTSTITFAPTLPLNEAGLRMLDLLANNGNCRLPCFWGITPGRSSTMEANNILNQLGNLSFELIFRPTGGEYKPIYFEKGSTSGYLENDLVIFILFSLKSDKDNSIVSHISFHVNTYIELPEPSNPGNLYPEILGNNPIGEKLAFYLLQHILSEDGRPSSVLIYTYSEGIENPDYWPFDMLLLYPDQGILIHYYLEPRKNGTNILGCLLNNNLEIELYPSGNGDAFMDLLDSYWIESLPIFKPIDEVTSMSLNQFYETFRKPTDQCLVTPSKYWNKFER